MKRRKKKKRRLKEAISSTALGQLNRSGVLPEKVAKKKSKKEKKECAGNCAGGCRGCKFVKQESDKGAIFLSLHEAKVNVAKREIDCTLITQGPGNEVDMNFYGQEAIASGSVVFNGAQAYINHQTEGEAYERPEGDIWQLAGYWKNVRQEQVLDRETNKTVPGVKGTLVCDESPAGDVALAKAKAAIEYRELFPDSKEVYAGLSINYSGVPKGTVEIGSDEWTNIAEFVEGGSIDIVTKPARGGAYDGLVESVKRMWHSISNVETSEMKIKDIMKKLAEARKARAKLVAEGDKADAIKLGEASTAVDKFAGMLEAAVAKAAEADDDKKPGEADDDKPSDEQDDDADTDEADDEYMEQLQPIMDGMEMDIEPEEMDKRMKAAIAAMKGESSEMDDEEPSGEADDEEPKKESDKIVESMKKDHPRVYARLMEHARSVFGEGRKDFKGVREANKKLIAANRLLTVKARVLSDTNTAEAKLAEADIPETILAAAHLVGLSESEMDAEIKRYSAIVTGGDVNFSREAGSGSGSGTVNPADFGVATKGK